jgi:hypothetical protein
VTLCLALSGQSGWMLAETRVQGPAAPGWAPGKAEQLAAGPPWRSRGSPALGLSLHGVGPGKATRGPAHA